MGHERHSRRSVAAAAMRTAPLHAVLLLLLGVGLLCAQTPAPDTPRPAPAALRLNIPAFELELLMGDSLHALYPVAVGEPRYRTPTGSFAITHITWNPWWYPPPSDWARDEPVHPPGDANPIGRVKMVFEPRYFLHGTPFESSIGSAASHGCVRMLQDDARALARALNAVGGGGLEDRTIAALEGSVSTTRMIALEYPVPLVITYVTIEIRKAELLLYPDVYRRDALTLRKALAQLAQAGYDTAHVHRAQLARLVRTARTRAVRMPIDSLLTHERVTVR